MVVIDVYIYRNERKKMVLKNADIYMSMLTGRVFTVFILGLINHLCENLQN